MTRFSSFTIAMLTTLCLTAALPAAAQVRIGTFDSRAVNVAFFNSPAGQKYVRDVMGPAPTEETKKDAKAMEAMRAKGRAFQILNHLRAFSTGSAADVLETVRGDLARVATEARVSCIVSKYELPFSADGVELVDVTDAVVALFHPNERGAHFAKEARNVEPMKMLDVMMIPADE